MVQVGLACEVIQHPKIRLHLVRGNKQKVQNEANKLFVFNAHVEKCVQMDYIYKGSISWLKLA